MRFRTAVARVALAVVAVFAAVGDGATARAAVPAQSGGSTAVVIVDTGSGVHQSVIHFDGSVSGYTALQLAGANPVSITYGALGQAVCQLYGAGDPPVPSECPGGWVYYRAVGGAGGWTQSSLGVSNTTVHDGDVEGWKYGGGQPPFSSFCSVVGCAPPPTDPPPVTQAPPPVTSPPAVGPSTPTPEADGSTVTPTTSAGKDSGKAKGDGATADSGEAATADGKGDKDSKAGSTTTTGKSGTTASDRRQRSGTAEVAAGGTGGGSDGGSPIGVIVAVAVVAVAVAGGLLVRRRRGGPAPG